MTKPIKRPSKDKYYWNVALAVSQRSTCLRMRIGAVIVSGDEIISTGYVGAPRETPNCIDLGICYRQEKEIPSGTRYELCRSVHAEENAIIHAPRRDMIGATMYIAGQNLKKSNHPIVKIDPCEMCRRKIINAGLEKVISYDAEGNIYSTFVESWIDEAKTNPFMHLDDPDYGKLTE